MGDCEGTERRRQEREKEKSYDWLGKSWNSWAKPTESMVEHMDAKSAGADSSVTLADQYARK